MPLTRDVKSPHVNSRAHWSLSRGATNIHETTMADPASWPFSPDPLPDLGATLTPPPDLDNNVLTDIDGKFDIFYNLREFRLFLASLH